MMKRRNTYQDLELHRVTKEELEEERRLEAAGALFSTQHPDSDARMVRKMDRHYHIGRNTPCFSYGDTRPCLYVV